MNPAPKVPPEISAIFHDWAIAAKQIAESPKTNASLRAKILNACETVAMLGNLDKIMDMRKERHVDQPGAVAIGIVFLEPTVAYSRIVFIADILGQFPATARTPCALENAAKVAAWMRIQRSWNGHYANVAEPIPSADLHRRA
jgi:hypothetical protein